MVQQLQQEKRNRSLPSQSSFSGVLQTSTQQVALYLCKRNAEQGWQSIPAEDDTVTVSWNSAFNEAEKSNLSQLSEQRGSHFFHVSSNVGQLVPKPTFRQIRGHVLLEPLDSPHLT